MSPKQRTLYWREWSKAWAAMRALDPALQSRDAERSRHDLHREALGYPRSSRDMDNREFDAVLARMRAWSQPADLNTQRRAMNQPRIRMLWTLTNRIMPRLAVLLGGDEQAEAYAHQILLGRFRTDDHTTLNTSALQQFLVTLKERLGAMEPEPMEETV